MEALTPYLISVFVSLMFADFAYLLSHVRFVDLLLREPD